MVGTPLYSCFVLVDKFVGESARRPVSRVLSAPSRGGATIPLGRASRRASRGQPGQRSGNAPGVARADPRRRLPLFGLAPGGVYPATPVAGGAVRSCRTVSPLPTSHDLSRGWAVCSLWHCPWGRPRRPLAGTVFPWSPDFPPPPRPRPERQRLPGRLAAVLMRQAHAPRQDAEVSRRAAARTAARRARVPRSAKPVTASGRQCRWKARSTAASASSRPLSGLLSATR